VGRESSPAEEEEEEEAEGGGIITCGMQRDVSSETSRSKSVMK